MSAELQPEKEWRDCVGCSGYIEECKHVVIEELTGHPKPPPECWLDKLGKVIFTPIPRQPENI